MISDLVIEYALADFIKKTGKPKNDETIVIEQEYNHDLQIDWITAKIPFFYKGRLNGGNIINTTVDGEIEYTIEKRLPITGSYASKLSVRTSDVLGFNGDTWVIEISGNPVKWFQGHNLFGTGDLTNLVYETFCKLSEVLNSPQPASMIKAVKNGHYVLSRVDITGMYALPCRSDVYAWLNHAEKTSRTRSGTSLSKGNTVYLNKSSERFNIVFYSKGQELEKHKLPPELSDSGLTDYADNKLRAELRLRGKELTRLGLRNGVSWQHLDLYHVYQDYMGRVEMTAQEIRADKVFEIPKVARMTYEIWTTGKDVRQFISKASFYRHRKILLEFGVDISVPKPVEMNTNVIPFRRFLDLQPAGVPDWAKGTNLYFEPRKICK